MIELVQAKHLDGWVLVDVNTGLMIRKNELPKVDSNGEPVLIDDPNESGQKVQDVSISLQSRGAGKIQIRRLVVGVTFYQSARGMRQSAFRFETGPDTAFPWTTPGGAWVCSEDRLQLQSLECGAYVQEQTWEYYGSWSNLPAGYFGAMD